MKRLILSQIVAIILAQASSVSTAFELVDSEKIADIAKKSSVRIEGFTQGSGVIVGYSDNMYTVLTAWHVVAGHSAGEVFIVYTSDNKPHALDPAAVTRIAGSDMAYFKFVDLDGLPIAKLKGSTTIPVGSRIYVAGHSRPSATIPMSIFRFTSGILVANIDGQVPDYYKLVYDNATVVGMSGGGVFDAAGMLIGIHGREESSASSTPSDSATLGTRNKLGMPTYIFSGLQKDRSGLASTRQSLPVNVSEPSMGTDKELHSIEAIPTNVSNFRQDLQLQPSSPLQFPQTENENKPIDLRIPLKTNMPDASVDRDAPTGNTYKELIDKSRSLSRDTRKGAFREP